MYACTPTEGALWYPDFGHRQVLLAINAIVEPDDRGPELLALPMHSDGGCATSKL